MEWISCKDRLPEEGTTVLIGRGPIAEDGGEVTMAYLYRSKWWEQIGDDPDVMDIDSGYWTHWMPLPDPSTLARPE